MDFDERGAEEASMRRFLEVIDGASGESYQVELRDDHSEDHSLTPGERPRRTRQPRAPSWVRAPRPSEPPPLRAS